MQNTLCNECDYALAVSFCQSCEQNLCLKCDLKIHDKGKRKAHLRQCLSDPTFYDEKANGICISQDNNKQNMANAIVFCLSLNVVSKDSKFQDFLLKFIRLQAKEKQAQTIYMLVWNSIHNENINKILLSVQIELFKENVIVYFIKFLLDLRNFFENFKKDEEKFTYIYILASSTLKESLEECEFSSKQYNLAYFDEDFSLIINDPPSISIHTPKKTIDNTEDLNQTILNADIRKTKEFIKNTEIKHSKSFYFSDYQPYKTLNPLYFPSKISLLIQDLLRDYARMGLLMIEKSEFFMHLSKKLYENMLCKPEDFPMIVLQAENMHLFHTTIRRFDNIANIYHFISIHLDEISLESLIWVLRSLMRDEMTPNEKVILSRIKESYSLKMSYEHWKQILEMLILQMDKNSLIKRNTELPPLRIENSNNEEICVFLAWEKWICRDQGTLGQMDQEDWDEFLDFLRKFYFCSSFSKLSFKSVENLLEKSEGKKKYGYFNKKFLKNFIPGGKYGCCQYIKCCGTPKLKQISFGRLSLLVQEAINRKLIEYYKTLLIATEKLKILKINLEETENFTQFNHEKHDFHQMNQLHLNTIKEIILRIIGSFTQGINLARLPKMIQFYSNFPFDCQEFGFKKLKDFLNIFPEIEMIEFGDNIVAKLKINSNSNKNDEDFISKWKFVNDPMYSYNCYKNLENSGILRKIYQLFSYNI